MKKYAERFYKSKQWQHVRDLKMKSVGGLCEDCLDMGMYTPGEIVHHIVPITKENICDPDITLAMSNLRVLCREHHEKVHRKKQKRYTIDAEGHVIIKLDKNENW